MPPCFDVYAWVRTQERSAVLARFVDRYVDTEDPGEPRFEAFVRAVVEEQPTAGDLEALADLRRGPDSSRALSIYLHARAHYEAIVTITEEGDLVLGLALDDPANDPTVPVQAEQWMAELKAEFRAVAAVGGVELPPPQSAAEWREEGLAILRSGEV